MYNSVRNEVLRQLSIVFDDVQDAVYGLLTKQPKVTVTFKTVIRKEDDGVEVDTKLSVGQDAITSVVDMPVVRKIKL